MTYRRHCLPQHFNTGYELEHRMIDHYNFVYITRGQVVWSVTVRYA